VVTKISVVIPAFNEEKSISRTLSALAKQKTKHEFEVIVVNNNSTDKTANVAKKFSKELNLKVIAEKRKGRGKARDTGCRKATGGVIFSMDADTIPPSNWIESMYKYFNYPDVVAVTGPWEVRDCKGFKRWFLNHCQTPATLPYILFRGHYWLTGFNFAIRKSAYIKCGGFNTKINAHEDIDLTERVRKLGKIVYASDAKVVTSSRRYANGIINGLWSYEEIGIRYFIFKDKSIVLDDKR
jgi:glycosyltransferase involved in cell wall biosynthesis